MLVLFKTNKDMVHFIKEYLPYPCKTDDVDQQILVSTRYKLFIERPYFYKNGSSLFKEIGYCNELCIVILPKYEDQVVKILGDILDQDWLEVKMTSNREKELALIGISMKVARTIWRINTNRDPKGAYCSIEKLDSSLRRKVINAFTDGPRTMWSPTAVTGMQEFLLDGGV